MLEIKQSTSLTLGSDSVTTMLDDLFLVLLSMQHRKKMHDRAMHRDAGLSGFSWRLIEVGDEGERADELDGQPGHNPKTQLLEEAMKLLERLHAST